MSRTVAKTKKHPAHLVREIRRMGDSTVCGWSIHPEQLAAMQRRSARNLELQMVLLVPALPAETRRGLAPLFATAALRAIGLPVQSSRQLVLSAPAGRGLDRELIPAKGSVPALRVTIMPRPGSAQR